MNFSKNKNLHYALNLYIFLDVQCELINDIKLH